MQSQGIMVARWLALLVCCTGGAPASACGGLEPCRVEGGQYYALPPAGWYGTVPLPATIFFHGWRSHALAHARNAAFVQSFHDEGVLLVLPDGREMSWAHVGSPDQSRDELAFMDRVRVDLMERFAVDGRWLLVTGFSQGGSMVWDLACYRGADYTAFAPVSGAFWEPLPGACATPVHLRHEHGTTDGVVPMTGRAIRETFRQGDVQAGMAVWRAADRCDAAPDRVEVEGASRCEVWSTCRSGKELRLCLHTGGHTMPEGTVHRIHAWARGLDR